MGTKRKLVPDWEERLLLSPTPELMESSSGTDSFLNFNSLPFDCQYHILSRIPLQTLIPYRLVCSNWNLNIEKFCATKGSLKLVLYLPLTKPRANERPKDCDLYYAPDLLMHCRDPQSRDKSTQVYLEVNLANLNMKSIAGLTQIFQRVEYLTIVLNYKLTKSYDMSRVSNLLRLWSPNLQAFSLLINNSLNSKPSERRFNAPILERLHQMIGERVVDNFASLRQLHLCYGPFGLYFLLGVPKPQLNLPGNFLRQLEQLSLDCYTDNMVELLSQLGPNLTHLSLDCRLFPNGINRDPFIFLLIRLNQTLTHTVTHLRLFIDEPRNLAKFCAFFHAVRYLQLGCTPVVNNTKKPTSNIRILPHIEGVRHLSIYHQRLFLQSLSVPMTLLTSTWIRAISILPQLTILRLHRFEFDLNITASLPNVHTLILHHPSPLVHNGDLKHFVERFQSQFPGLVDLSLVSIERYQRYMDLFGLLRSSDFPSLVHFRYHLNRNDYSV